MAKEIVTLEEIAQRLKYSTRYMANNWYKLLPGIKPVKLGVNRNLRFFWDDIEQLLLKDK